MPKNVDGALNIQHVLQIATNLHVKIDHVDMKLIEVFHSEGKPLIQYHCDRLRHKSHSS
jgi:hypothetical protein